LDDFTSKLAWVTSEWGSRFAFSPIARKPGVANPVFTRRQIFEDCQTVTTLDLCKDCLHNCLVTSSLGERTHVGLPGAVFFLLRKGSFEIRCEVI
jgi:hypothetical protein